MENVNSAISSAISEDVDGILAHPFIQRLNEGKYSLNEIRIFAEQYFLLSAAFVDFLLLASTRIEDDADRSVFIVNLFDEHGRGNNKANHRRLLKKFLLSSGCKETNHIKPLDKTAAYIHGMRGLCREGTQLEVLGALGPGCESFTVEQYILIKEGLEKSFEFTKDDLIFFTSHIAHDPKHTNDIDDVIHRLVKSSDDLNQVISGARQSIIFENMFWDGLYEACIKR